MDVGLDLVRLALPVLVLLGSMAPAAAGRAQGRVWARSVATYVWRD